MDLEQLARREVVSTAHLTAAGHADTAIAAVRDGRLFSLLRGWYAVRPPLDGPDLH